MYGNLRCTKHFLNTEDTALPFGILFTFSELTSPNLKQGKPKIIKQKKNRKLDDGISVFKMGNC